MECCSLRSLHQRKTLAVGQSLLTIIVIKFRLSEIQLLLDISFVEELFNLLISFSFKYHVDV